MTSLSLNALLSNATSADPNLRVPAEQQIKQLEATSLPDYMTNLCHEVGAASEPQTRHLAGILLKNCFVAKDPKLQEHLRGKWLMLNEQVRQNVKNGVLQALASPFKESRSTAAMIVAKIAAIEIPLRMWTNLIDLLLYNIDQAKTADLQQSTFEALGYVCEECPKNLKESSNAILNGIQKGMKPTVPPQVRLAATVALHNSLEFVRDNFSNNLERKLIMEMVFTNASNKDPNVKGAAFECMVEIASNYYDYIEEFMQIIFNFTKTAVTDFFATQENEEIALQALEFWSTICDEELEILQDIEEAKEKGITPPRRNCRYFAGIAYPHLTPILLEALTKQQESMENDDQSWDIAMAAGTCLGLLTQVVKDPIVDHIVPFSLSNLQSENWRFREAATLAFGSLLDGPSRATLTVLVNKGFPILLNHMKDSCPLVKDTAAWCVGRICDLLPETINSNLLPKLMEFLMVGLSESPKIASNICWAIHNLAEAIEVGPEDSTSPMSNYFKILAYELLKVTERSDSHEGNLLGSAYEALIIMIQTSASDVIAIIGELLLVFMKRLKQTFAMQTMSGGDKEKQNQIQALLCGVLQSIIQKIGKQHISPHADDLMMLFLQVLTSKNATVHEEALMAVGSVASCLEIDFLKYLPHFKQFLIYGLMNVEETQVCLVSIGVVGDICRALDDKIMPICDQIVNILLQHLQSTTIDRSLKPHIISCLGDIALAISGEFNRYTYYVIFMLVQHSSLERESNDSENIDYFNTLRASILETYTGIIRGLNADNKGMVLNQFVSEILKLLQIVSDDQRKDENVLRAATGLIGDLVDILGQQIQHHISSPPITTILQQADSSADETTRKNAQWSMNIVKNCNVSVRYNNNF